jgi:outer membrane protein assembly factor BamB
MSDRIPEPDTSDAATIAGPVSPDPAPPVNTGKRHADAAATVATSPSGPTAGPPQLEVPPALLERFEIVKTLGRGGMGIVYVARDRRLDREVAVKLMLASSDAMRAQFEVEGRSLAALDDNHVVRLYDYGIAGDVPYLVMEYVRGRPLSLQLTDGRPSVLGAVRIILDILKGVAAAHAKGITHRDLKPANVFIDEKGGAKVADFGVAVMSRSQQETGISGSPGYMAPEQAMGTGGGPPIDIYATGVVLHQLLTGQRLFVGNSVREILESQLNACPMPPSRINPSVPSVLDQMVDPSKRPTALEMIAELKPWYDRVRTRERASGAAGFPHNPYKLLESYGASDSVIYFGRNAETFELIEMLEHEGMRILFLFGPCGIGKTSLLHSGVIPRLERSQMEIISFTAGADPAASVRQALMTRAALHDISRVADGKLSTEAMVSRPDLVVQTAAALHQKTGRRVLIVIDQTEEVFTQNPSESPRREQFFDMLVRLVDAQLAGVKIILSYRSEFRAQFFPLEERFGRHQKPYLVRGMSEGDLLEAIRGPTEIEFYGFHYEDGFCEHLAQDIIRTSRRTGQAPLPVLQIICSQLYDEMKAHGRSAIGDALYNQSLGGAAGALERYVEKRLSSAEYSHGRGIARQILKSLTVKDPGGERYSRTCDPAELLAFLDADGARRSLDRLMADHLVTMTVEADGHSTVRLASEVICRIVDTWVLEPDPIERAYRFLTRGYADWQESDHRPEELLSGPALRAVNQYLGALQSVTPAQRRYVEASNANHRQRQVTRLMLGVALGSLFGIVGYLMYLKPGELRLSSIPDGAVVSVGQQILGKTPLTWRARPGVYQLELNKTGYTQTAVVTKIRPGGTSAHEPVLAYPRGFLQVSSDPLGARCEIRPMSPRNAPIVSAGSTPLTTELDAGKYIVSVKEPGYLPSNTEAVEVKPNRTMVPLVVRLSQDTGTILSGSAFGAADMVIRDLDTGKKVWEALVPMKRPHSLVVGRYLMECTAPGAVSFSQTVQIALGKEVRYTAWCPPIRSLWTYDGASAGVHGDPAVTDLDGDRTPDVIVGSCDHKVHAISGRNGELLWTFETGDELEGSPVIGDLNADGQPDVIVGSVDHRVYALAGKDGHLLWSAQTKGPIVTGVSLADLNGDGTLDVVTVSQDHHIYVFSGKDGKTLWVVGTEHDVRSAPAVGDLEMDGVADTVVSSTDGNLYAHSGRSGELIWKARLGGRLATAGLADIDGDLRADAVVGSSDGDLYCVSGKTGQRIWSAKTGGMIVREPALGDLSRDGVTDAVVGCADGKVYAFAGRTGKLLWSHDVGGAIYSVPLLVDLNSDGRLDVLVGSVNGRVFALSGADGTEFWSYSTGNPVGSVAAADFAGDGVPDFVVAQADGRVRGLGARTGMVVWAFDALSPVELTPILVDVDGDDVPDPVVATTAGYLRTVSGKCGTELWNYRATGEILGIAAVPAVHQKGATDIVMASADGVLLCLANDGKTVRWTHLVSGGLGAPVTGQQSPSNPMVVVPTSAGVRAVSANTGRLLWEARVPNIRQSVGVGDIDGDGCEDVVATSTTGEVLALSGKNGAIRWSFLAGGAVMGAEIVDLRQDGRRAVVFGCEDRFVYALAGVDGKLLWTTDTQRPLASRPAFADLTGDGVLDTVVGTAYREVAAISGADGAPLWRAEVEGPVMDAPSLRDLNEDGVPDVLGSTKGRRVFMLDGKNGKSLFTLSVGGATGSAPLLLAGESFRSGRSPVLRVERTGRAPLMLTVWKQQYLVLNRLPWPFRPVQDSWATRARVVPVRPFR